jgi:hypothetical protein
LEPEVKSKVFGNPSLGTKSLSQSRYGNTSSYLPSTPSRINRSRWGDDLKSKNDKYDFNMFSNYINNTFQVPTRSRNENLSKPTPNLNSYNKPTFLGSKTYKYQEQPKYTPTMTESKYIRSSSSNNNPTRISTTQNYLNTNQYDISKKYTTPGVKTYRIIHGTPAEDFQPVKWEREVQKEPVYISSTGGRTLNGGTVRLNKGVTRYEGGNRQGLVQSMYREKPSNLLEMKYGNVTSTGMRF